MTFFTHRPQPPMATKADMQECMEALVETNRNLDAYVAEQKAKSRARTCADCGGFFQPEFLAPAYHGIVRFTGEKDDLFQPYFDKVYYCRGCEPVAPIVLVLQDDKGKALETRFFQVDRGWFQDVDEASGEHRYTVSCEDYNHIFCTDCGELIEETECQECRTPAKKDKK